MNPSDLTIEQFESGRVDAHQFTHEAHIYLAWLYLKQCETADAIERFDRALHRLVKKLGVEERYNAMVTWLFIKLIAERMREGEDWRSFRACNDDLVNGRPRATQ